ncbi:hypothetical protein IV203_017828 [Nitzschia inconspicua]|uniref:Uncharacterized protein n=1 Tax=Nitzschia inconspicua TaxID=303405 RepID=A0A9K3KG62_9STRA|nr:hypothetical protein IV203_020529 [Nitzschia inconspicua]KAG7371687.1 hypothetical protein IV203_017828 [Nitzschia inconspicua]
MYSRDPYQIMMYQHSSSSNSNESHESYEQQQQVLFSHQQQSLRSMSGRHCTSIPINPLASRRVFGRQQYLRMILTTGGLFSLTAGFSPVDRQQVVVHAVTMQDTQTVFQVGKDLTLDQAIDRFQQGRQSLRYLIDNYDDIISKGGGDNVRRYLGTVGLTSGLYGINKVLKVLKEQAAAADILDDIVEFNELAEELVAAINQADGSAYMAIFTTTSTSGVPSQRYYDEAKIEIEQAIQTMDALAKLLHLSSSKR